MNTYDVSDCTFVHHAHKMLQLYTEKFIGHFPVLSIIIITDTNKTDSKKN